jgi:endonuclease YncB( thermonuclease family)
LASADGRPSYDAAVILARAAVALLAAAVAAGGAAAPPRCADARECARRRPGPARGASRGEVVLSGERVPVRWIDGDTFKIEAGRFAGRSARLAGVNALETFGPVHRIGALGGAELLALAKATGPFAAARAWDCEAGGAADRYGRLLVACPGAAAALVREGYAMVYAVDAPPDARLLEVQRAAQAARAGMWAGGAPRLVPTSLHSADEPDLGPGGAYDRIADTRTGVAAARPHARAYAACEEICVGAGADRACMTYVPYARRYRHRPACLRDGAPRP